MIIRWLLMPLGWLYGLGLSVYLLPYRLKLRRQHKLGVPVISVGNLSCGGTGKSPIVRQIVSSLQAQGLKPCIVSYGYGGSLSGLQAIVSDGSKISLSPSEAGDEPVMLARLTGAPVVIGKKRELSGALAIKTFQPDFIILDDGLQYWQLFRDLDIVVVDAANPPYQDALLPAGRLREPATALKRAGAIVLTNCSSVSDTELARVRGWLQTRLKDGCKVFESNKKPGAIRTLTGTPAELEGKPVIAVTAIARPESFLNLLQEACLSITERFMFPDHHAYQESDLAPAHELLQQNPGLVVITTEKDADKLTPFVKDPERWLVMDVDVVIQDQEELLDLITRLRR